MTSLRGSFQGTPSQSSLSGPSLGSGVGDDSSGMGSGGTSTSGGAGAEQKEQSHRAFHFGAVLESKKSKITALETHEGTLFVAMGDGLLQWYESDNDKVVFRQTLNEPICNKPIEQMHVVDNMLILLSDGLIRVHQLPSLKKLDELERAKGAYMFSASRGNIPSPGKFDQVFWVFSVFLGRVI